MQEYGRIWVSENLFFRIFYAVISREIHKKLQM